MARAVEQIIRFTLLSCVTALVLACTGTMSLFAQVHNEQGRNPLFGTWASVSPEPGGGQNHMWFTYAPAGEYRMVSVVTGGSNNGQQVQRWGKYQWRGGTGGQYEVAVHQDGGAPAQICARGQGCTEVQGLQAQFKFAFEITGDELRQGNAIFKRANVPTDLQKPIPATRWQAALPAPPAGRRYNSPSHGPATNIPGIGGNCDDLQQQRICTVNGGHMYTDRNTGCQVCAGP